MVGRARSAFYGFVGTLLLFVTCQFCVFPSAAGAQSTLGDDAVCTSNTTTCGVTAPTSAFIDAFASSQANNFSDLCLVPLMFPRAVAS